MAKKKADTPKVEEYRSFRCITCDPNVELDNVNALKAHLKDTHRIGKGAVGSKKMVYHADATDHYSGTDEWAFGDVKVLEYYKYARRGEDKAMWESMG